MQSMGIECKTSIIGSVIGRGKIKGIIAIIEKTEGGVQLPLWQSLVYGTEIVSIVLRSNKIRL